MLTPAATFKFPDEPQIIAGDNSRRLKTEWEMIVI